MVIYIHPLNFIETALKKVKIHGNIILHPSFHEVLGPCLTYLSGDQAHF